MRKSLGQAALAHSGWAAKQERMGKTIFLPETLELFPLFRLPRVDHKNSKARRKSSCTADRG